MSKRYIILDCDGGSDDAWALLMLLKAEAENYLEILGITICGCGNTSLKNAARNMLQILKASDREDIPIYLGAADSLISSAEASTGLMFHGEDGFGDILIKDDDKTSIQAMEERKHAVNIIYELCSQKPKEVTIIAVGPLTNIALCYSLYGKVFAESLKDIYLMGGNYQGVGNFTRCAEFNFYSDPEAAHIVLTKSICSITILPWEPCLEHNFFISLNWRLHDFGARACKSNAAAEILNKVEEVQYTKHGFKCWNPCDAILVAAYLFDTRCICKQSMWHVTVDLKGCHTRGQMVLDHLHEIEKYPKNVRIIELIDADFFKKAMEWTVGLKTLQFKS